MDYHINSRSWEHILLFLRRGGRIHTKQERPLLLFVEAVWYIARSGSQWRWPWRSVHRRFKRWSDAGIWERLMIYVSYPDMESIMLDVTIVRAHACSAGLGHAIDALLSLHIKYDKIIQSYYHLQN